MQPCDLPVGIKLSTWAVGRILICSCGNGWWWSVVYQMGGSGVCRALNNVKRCRSRGTLLELWLGKRATSRDKGGEKWLHRG